MPFDTPIKKIKTGEPVSATVTNRPIEQIDQNTQYLLDLINAAALGSTVYARRVSVEADAVKGMAVYYNNTTQQFERAIATTRIDNNLGLVETSEKSQVYGIVALKHNSTLADILLFGRVALDLSAAIVGDDDPGLYYLSGIDSGKLVKQRPPVSIAVLRLEVDGTVFVNPQFIEFVDRHNHYKFALTCLPAGDHTEPDLGDPHVINSADSDLPGWLPADDPVFNENAPNGAKFGYNLSADPGLQNIWPPIPLNSAILSWYKAISIDVGATVVPINDLVLFDENGIWWMSDCYQDVPWPFDFNSSLTETNTNTYGECPRDLIMQMDLFFSRVEFATDGTLVSSLVSLDDRLIVKCANGAAGSTGPLTIDMDLDFQIDQTGTRGATVFKELVTDKFNTGIVVEGIYAGSDNITLSSNLPAIKLDPEDEASADVYQGLVRITALSESTSILGVEKVRVDGVENDTFDDILFLSFATGRETGYRARVDVPPSLGIASPEMRLRFLLLGRTTGTMPDLTLTARIISRPSDGLDTPVALPTSSSEFSVALITSAIITVANQYVEATSDAFEITAGDVIFFSLIREDGDAYGGDIGVIQEYAIVSAGA